MALDRCFWTDPAGGNNRPSERQPSKPAAISTAIVSLQHIRMFVALALGDPCGTQFVPGPPPILGSPENFAAFTKSEHDKFARLIKAAGIQPE